MIPTPMQIFREDLMRKAQARMKTHSAQEVAWLLVAGVIVMETLEK